MNSLLRATALLAFATPALCAITGTWFNELGSNMIIFADQNGTLSGKYNSAVGNAEDYYVLAGRYDTAPPADEGVTLGWVVAYHNDLRNAHSTATWSGQYFGGDEETILTHWLLTSSTSLDDVWESTQIGTDVFTREKPTEDKTLKARSSGKGSPHPEKIVAKRLRK